MNKGAERYRKTEVFPLKGPPRLVSRAFLSPFFRSPICWMIDPAITGSDGTFCHEGNGGNTKKLATQIFETGGARGAKDAGEGEERRGEETRLFMKFSDLLSTSYFSFV